MNLYQLFQPLFFRLSPETAHHVTLMLLQCAYQFGFIKPHVISSPRNIMGLDFPNPIGLAAGLDKNGDYIDALAALGFGFIEIGTVTPKPQNGNLKPRLFRLREQEAIINRMGFNNRGVEYVVARLKKTRFSGILGINIGKNRDTSHEQAVDDYLFCFRQLAPFASYITLNISSPNTPGLRELQQGDALTQLLRALKKEQWVLFANTQKYVPLVIKIAPDLEREELCALVDIILAEKIDGIIATNTTINREGVEPSVYAKEAGGLSGRPLKTRSTWVVQQLYDLLQGRIPIIASGGMLSQDDVREKMEAGASLIQLYTGLVYRGPELIAEAARFNF